MASSLWLIGAGEMAKAYVAVLQDQNISFEVICRSQARSEAFAKATGITPLVGGIEKVIKEQPLPQEAIVAVGIEQILPVTQLLLHYGFTRILIEKPGALLLDQLSSLYSLSRLKCAEIWIAYNRRFYSSVVMLKELIIRDGGIQSAYFEFTERSDEIEELETSSSIKKRWLLANSTHVIDLAFYLIGLPQDGQWSAWSNGKLDWHPSAARFHGADRLFIISRSHIMLIGNHLVGV